jgi:hypothetical protein
MFERFGVNSLSAFRHKFWAYQLDPAVGGSRTNPPASALPSPPTISGSRSRWQVQQLGEEMYVGEILDGRRHGCGILLVKVGNEVARLPTHSGAISKWHSLDHYVNTTPLPLSLPR